MSTTTYYKPLTGIPPLRNPPQEIAATKKVKHSIFSCLNRLYEWMSDRYNRIHEEHSIVMNEPMIREPQTKSHYSAQQNISKIPIV